MSIFFTRSPCRYGKSYHGWTPRESPRRRCVRRTSVARADGRLQPTARPGSVDATSTGRGESQEGTPVGNLVMLRRMRRLVLAAVSAFLLAATALPSGVSASAAPGMPIWHKCRDDAFTWTLSVSPEAKNVQVARVRNVLEGGFRQITAATNGMYRFRYVRTAPLTIAWGTSGRPMEEEQGGFVPFSTMPSVDMLLAVLPDPRPSPGNPPSYNFSGTDVYGLVDASLFLESDGRESSYATRAEVLDNGALDRHCRRLARADALCRQLPRGALSDRP